MKRILLVEDNHAILENTSELLELADYVVITACNGKQGLKKAMEEKPDLILCDIMMPEIDGYHFLEIIRREPIFENTPFLFFTASSERSEIEKGLSAGANGYIIKPFDADELIQLVDNYLR